MFVKDKSEKTAYLEESTAQQGYNEVFWDGKDKNGDSLANSVYFYKIIVKTEEGRFSKIGKMAVMR